MGAQSNDFIGLIMAALLAAGCADDASPKADFAAGEGDDEVAQQVAELATPRPIVLVAGLLQDKKTIAPMVDFLEDEGFDVTVYVPPMLGLGDINRYATALGRVVDDVRERTGASRVDLIGHSQGGVTARRYAQLAGPNAPVHTLISMGSPQQGTELGALVYLLSAAGFLDGLEGAKQLLAGSTFLTQMNRKSDPTPGDTRYVAIGTEQDQVTKPVARSAIPGGEHVVMQDACPRRNNVGHFGLLNDAWVQQVVLAVLAGGPAEGDCSARPLGGPT